MISRVQLRSLESLLEKYPDAPEELETFYQLYLSSLSAGDHVRAEKYKATDHCTVS